MRKIIIHLSDLHYRTNWEEEQELVLNTFFKDLSTQLIQKNKADIYIAFSGDLVFAGSDKELYKKFFEQFDSALNQVGIPKKNRICIPGNHDISALFVENNKVEHQGIISQKLNEKEFNDYISKSPPILSNKFNNYRDLETNFAELGISSNILSGVGHDIDENIGIYCLNTSICSSGGFNKINDKNQLAIDTRNIQKWLQSTRVKQKILIMHHSLDWLTEWAQERIKQHLRNEFVLCLSGHVHDQSLYHIINKDFPLIECSAPPLLTEKEEKRGYSMISISENGVLEIEYRQWTKYKSFRTGVDFSDTDDGKIIIKKEGNDKNRDDKDMISLFLSNRLDSALRMFSSQPIIWVEPILSKTNEISKRADDKNDYRINVEDIVKDPKSIIIKAPPQFGLTCLAHYLVREAWVSKSEFWLYIDFINIKSAHRLRKAIQKELGLISFSETNIKCIILDSWTNIEKEAINILEELSKSYKMIPIIVMQTIEDSNFLNESTHEKIDRDFDVIHLLALPRSHVRHVVSEYNNKKHIGDEDTVMIKVVSDLDALNIHRTAFNCLTLLKVSEKYFDESPVNRTRMLEMVLFVLFDMEGIPTYKTKPDLKDCEYILGYFCEYMIRTETYYFTREDFIAKLKFFCSQQLIDLEVDIVFDILHKNNIIVNRGLHYAFRFSYWIYYFAARRMYQDQNFADYIFAENRYTAYPEIIEFYTGIDRKRENILKILTDDVKKIRSIVENKVGLPTDMNPYNLARWVATPESIERINNELSENVLSSKLPKAIKDQYADQGYDFTKPYDQSINTIFRDYSLTILTRTIRAASSALRNSDYVDPTIKRELLKEVLNCWNQYSLVVIALTPILATYGYATYEGTAFEVMGNMGNTFKDRCCHILEVIPNNVVQWFKNDLYSHKMGPLLYDQIGSEHNELKKHELALLIIKERPRNWRLQIESYITSISHNSFYLMSIVDELRNQYRFSFATPHELTEIAHLIKMGLAKHTFEIKKPGLDKISKIPNTYLPKRDDDKL